MMLLSMKVGTNDVNTFLKSVSLLEKEGIKINGFELQVLKNDSVESVMKAVEIIRDNFKARIQGLHPPFPAFADKNFLKWKKVSEELGLNYIVLHASIKKKDFSLLRESVQECIGDSRKVFVENLTFNKNHLSANLLETTLLSEKVLFDIHHTIFDYKYSGRLKVSPIEQVKLALNSIVAVHCADSVMKDAVIPKKGGTRLFKNIMKILFNKKNIIYIAEPKNGHLNNYEGHVETCRQVWKLWENIKDN